MVSLLRFPRPRTFLHFVSLRTAAEFISLTLAINKITGLYGVLALFTGYSLNPLQFSHYIYSLLLLALVAYLSPAIRDRNRTLHSLALAWIYVLDTFINAAYTALFGLGWFVLLAQHLNDPVGTKTGAPGKGTMSDTAGFTDPNVNATEVNIIVKPGDGIVPGQEGVAFQSGSSSTGQAGTLGGALFADGSMASVTILCLLVLIRLYCCIVMLSFARSAVRAHIASASAADPTYSNDSSASADPTMAVNPFAQTTGWQGKLGRAMLRLPTQRYWLGRDESEEEWIRATSGRFQSNGRALKISVPGGVGERERRARSGTGPPIPTNLNLGKLPQ